MDADSGMLWSLEESRRGPQGRTFCSSLQRRGYYLHLLLAPSSLSTGACSTSLFLGSSFSLLLSATTVRTSLEHPLSPSHSDTSTSSCYSRLLKYEEIPLKPRCIPKESINRQFYCITSLNLGLSLSQHGRNRRY